MIGLTKRRVAGESFTNQQLPTVMYLPIPTDSLYINIVISLLIYTNIYMYLLVFRYSSSTLVNKILTLLVYLRVGR